MHRFAARLPLVALSALMLVVAPDARSDEAGWSRSEAAAHFTAGRRAYESGDFQRAGQLFDRAYAVHPHHDALWNAARAWQAAGEPTKAADDFARYVAEAPADAPDRNAAQVELRKLSQHLGRLRVSVTDDVVVTVDGFEGARPLRFVEPGSHAVVARRGGREHRETVLVRAGETRALAFDWSDVEHAPSPRPPARPTPAASSPLPQDDGSHAVASSREHKPLSPWVVYSGAGAAVGLGGVTTWSGLDTLAARDRFDSDRSPENLSDGRTRQLRTNILLGSAIGLALFTTAAAVFFTDWSAAERKATTQAGPPWTLRW